MKCPQSSVSFNTSRKQHCVSYTVETASPQGTGQSVTLRAGTKQPITQPQKFCSQHGKKASDVKNMEGHHFSNGVGLKADKPRPVVYSVEIKCIAGIERLYVVQNFTSTGMCYKACFTYSIQLRVTLLCNQGKLLWTHFISGFMLNSDYSIVCQYQNVSFFFRGLLTFMLPLQLSQKHPALSPYTVFFLTRGAVRYLKERKVCSVYLIEQRKSFTFWSFMGQCDSVLKGFVCRTSLIPYFLGQ